MIENPVKRKLVAILSADAVGYSRLMGEDEEATVRTISTYREVISELTRQHRGRVVDTTGDNILAEFASVVDALKSAWDIQQEIKIRNVDLAEDRRMMFRIGINLGDVIAGERLYGDGVNVAARLESLAEAGGISISGTAYDQVKNKVPFRFEFQGEQSVKNIKDPVRVYRVEMTPDHSSKRDDAQKSPTKSKLLAVVFSVIAIVVLAAGLVYWVYLHALPFKNRPPGEQTNQPLAGKASIAVLPFKNLSGDPNEEYFSDGITNDIITDLSKFRHMLVISSNTTFTYKEQSLSPVDAGNELGVRYVLEGSIQKLGNTVRISTRLIDASNGYHIWGERYERDYADVFKLQEDIVRATVTKLAVKTFRFEQDRAMRKKTRDLEAYDYLLRGYAYLNRRTRSANIKAGEMFNKAIELDPYYAEAYAGLGWVNDARVSYGWTEFVQQALDNAFNYGRKALELDESNASAHSLLVSVYAHQNQYELAIRAAERALDLNPNDAFAYGEMGWVLLRFGRVDEAIAALEISLRLDSTSPRNVWWHLGMAYYLKEEYEKALNMLQKGVIKRPDFVGYQIAFAATYAQLGRTDEAARAVDALLRLDPFFEVASFGTGYRNPEDREKIVAGLRSAGLK